MEPEREQRRGWTLEVQSWHILLMLAVQLIGLGIAYGRISQKQEDLQKDLARIENQRVISKEEFDDWKQQLIERMNRIENKLDAGLNFK